jgi:hypothetical protein
VRGGGETVNFSFSLFDVCIQRAALSGGKKKSKQVWRLRLHNKTANTRNKTKKLKTKKKKAKRFAKYQHGRGKEITRPARESWYTQHRQSNPLLIFLSFFLSLLSLVSGEERKTARKIKLCLFVMLLFRLLTQFSRFFVLHFSSFPLFFLQTPPPTHVGRDSNFLGAIFQFFI